MKSYTSLILSIVFFLCCGSFIQGQPTSYSNTASYNVGDLVVSGSATYIAIAGNSGQTPPNTTFWTDLSVAATALNIPVELVPSIDVTTILASLPNAAPDVNSSSGGGSSSTSKFEGISCRGLVSSNQPMFGGFTIKGTENKKVAFMGKGKTMGVPGYATDTILEIHNSSGMLSVNDNWQTITDSNENLSTVSSEINGPEDSLESGMVMTLSPGNYSFVLKSKSGALGGAMVEAYEIDSLSSKFEGISCRGLVSSNQPMFGGFTIEGANLKVAFMGKGKTMGVPDYAIDTILEIHNSSGMLSVNDNWQSITDSNENLSTVSPQINGPEDKLESGMVMTLSPGNYSFVLKSKSGSVAGAMVEAYEVE